MVGWELYYEKMQRDAENGGGSRASGGIEGQQGAAEAVEAWLRDFVGGLSTDLPHKERNND